MSLPLALGSVDVSTDTGSWTPALTFATPGTFNTGFVVASGSYVQIGKTVIAQFTITAANMDKGTASGALKITGLPVPSAAAPGPGQASPVSQGFVTTSDARLTWPTGATQLICGIPGNSLSYVALGSLGSGVAGGQITASNVASGTVTLNLGGCIIYTVD